MNNDKNWAAGAGGLQRQTKQISNNIDCNPSVIEKQGINSFLRCSISATWRYQDAENSRTGWRETSKPCNIVAKWDWSPIIFYNGIRNEEHFKKCHYLYGDIDAGLTIENFKIIFADYRFILLTSRNHNRPKHGSVAQRFHVLFPRKNPYTTVSDLRADLAALVAQYSFFDSSVKDAARFFFGFKDVQIFRNAGREFKPKALPENVQNTLGRVYSINYDLAEICRRVRISGRACGRQDFCFRVNAWARRKGFNRNDIENALLSSPEGQALAAQEPGQFSHALRSVSI